MGVWIDTPPPQADTLYTTLPSIIHTNNTVLTEVVVSGTQCNSEQVCIPVGCVPPAHWPYPWWNSHIHLVGGFFPLPPKYVFWGRGVLPKYVLREGGGLIKYVFRGGLPKYIFKQTPPPRHWTDRCLWWSIQTELERHRDQDNWVYRILCLQFTLQLEWELELELELKRWVSNPFWNLPGDLTVELTGKLIVKLYVVLVPVPLPVWIKPIVLVPVPFPVKLCLNRPWKHYLR